VVRIFHQNECVNPFPQGGDWGVSANLRKAPAGAWQVGKGKMKSIHRIKLSALAVFGSLVLAAAVSAQQKQSSLPQHSNSYDASRETVLQGTVVSFTAQSSTAPFGAHVTVQTSSGLVDVHLGNPKLLEANSFSLSAGDSIKITGESVAFGNTTQFLARIIQKGNQSLTLRSVRGFPLRPINTKNANQQGGVL
jgi:hypothetical protein